ncbi:DUF6152 family protein [Novosphingobium mathurense]|uniref:Copper binding protein CusF n=1 Tax=Novosphingobium mathurense TaxID=428990 RepID=A0A1U6IVH7_9SPHN|nr:DUF6152 family protein [Novosphingobium mathurense]SLK12008.1 hypothetical protein SAMN06295987_11711 [Novosphingobium mathurense]
MKISRSSLLGLGAALSLIGVPATAHHSFAMFDQTKLIEMNGTVAKFQWANPHTFVIVKDAKGTVFTLECSSPNLMTHQGWKANTLAAGDKVHLTFYPLRNGKTGGMLKEITLPTGATLRGW